MRVGFDLDGIVTGILDLDVASRLLLQPVGEILPELFDLGLRDINDVGLVGIAGGIVLVIVLGDIKRGQWFERRDDGIGEYAGFVQLPDIGVGDPFLLIV